MGIMNTIEKVEHTIWSWGTVKLNTVIINGAKDGKDNRRDAFYYNSYDSKKYDDVSKLDNLSMNYSKFLVFSHKGYNENNDFETLEIYTSFQHLQDIKDLIIGSYEQIAEHASKIYGQSKINPKFEELIFEAENLPQGKELAIYPDKIEDGDGNLQNGIILVLKDDNLQIEQPIPFRVFEGLVEVIRNYDLLVSAHLTSIEGLLYKLLSGNGISSSGSSMKTRSSSSKSRSFKKSSGKSIKDILGDDDEDEEEISDDIEEEEEETPKKSVKKTTNKKSSPKKVKNVGKNLSLNAMMEAAEAEGDDDFGLDDDDEDGEVF